MTTIEDPFKEFMASVKESIEEIVAKDINTRIVVITDDKTPEQIDFIVKCAQDKGLKVITESHADMEKILKENLQKHISADAVLAEIPSAEAIKDITACAKQPLFSPTEDAYRKNRRDQREQMKLRMRFSNRKK